MRPQECSTPDLVCRGFQTRWLCLGLLSLWPHKMLTSQLDEISFHPLKQCKHANCSGKVWELNGLKMLNWFMELNSLKNLSCCEKGSWFKSPVLPAGRLSPSTLYGASSGLVCDSAAAKQPGSPPGSWVAQKLLWSEHLVHRLLWTSETVWEAAQTSCNLRWSEHVFSLP